MPNDDSIKLLKECNAGMKMAVTSIDEVLGAVQNESLKNILIMSKEAHEKLGDETHLILNKYDDIDKEPNPIAKVMSWMKINAGLLKNHTDQEIASLITDGCNMGIKSVHQYINQYKTAEKPVKDIAEKLSQLEEELMVDLRKYL